MHLRCTQYMKERDGHLSRNGFVSILPDTSVSLARDRSVVQPDSSVAFFMLIYWFLVIVIGHCNISQILSVLNVYKTCKCFRWHHKICYNLCCFAAKYESILEQFRDAVKTNQEQKALIGQLEDDLRKVNALSVMFRGDAEVSVHTLPVMYTKFQQRKYITYITSDVWCILQ